MVAMSEENLHQQETQHAFLVAWGWFAQHIGLIQAIHNVPLHQKTYKHSPHTKILEFLVALLGGLPYLQDISRAAHPLDQDQAVAQAWQQPAWADYSGVSRTLSTLSMEEVQALVRAVEQVEQPLIDAELARLRQQGERIVYDGDLTGLPVSPGSHTYPNAAFGYMDDEIRLGYQAAVVSLQSPIWGRLWLSGQAHPGDTVSCTQAEALVLAAEARTGLRPRRRTEWLKKRIEAFEQTMKITEQRLTTQTEAVHRAQERLEAACQQRDERQRRLAELEALYHQRQRRERPNSQLSQVRQRLQAAEHRVQSRQQALQVAERRLAKTQALHQAQQAEYQRLQARLQRFEQDNQTNLAPIAAEFRLDAGFGTYENIALLIEMGYEVYTKAHNARLNASLRRRSDLPSTWERVGTNAEMVAWPDLPLTRCPYPLDVGLERFHHGEKIEYSVLLHFGDDPVTENLPQWFEHYNGRQIIEAGIKESKWVFFLHHFKVRTQAAIYLQERLTLFAANFIRWAARWLDEQADPQVNTLNLRQIGLKRQVQVGAHVSAQVIESAQGKMLRFSACSAFSGRVLALRPGASP
jgi:hypothetical protein